jgi:hypothetical protein
MIRALRTGVIAGGSVGLLIYMPLALQVRIPGGSSGHWWGCLFASLLLIGFSIWGYRSGPRSARLRCIALCFPPLIVLGILLIEKYALEAWEIPMAYGIRVKVP